MNGRLFFAADDGMAGLELWTSDGTAAGTRLVKDIDPGIAGSAPEFLTNVNGTLFFRVEGPAGRFDLWKSDGTAGGTVPVKLQVGGLDAVDLVNVNGTLFFDGNDGVAGMELWKSDGTAAGTMLVADLDPSGDGFPFELTNANGTFFFRAQDPALGEQLWTSDGTSAGTVRLTDINPPRGARARFLTNVMGTWLLSETLRTWGETDLTGLLREAAAYDGQVPVVDVQDPRFLPPGDMASRIDAWCSERDVPAPAGRAAVVRCIVLSIAAAISVALDRAATLADRSIALVHVVGGGAQNSFLCQAIADASARPVLAGPVEATALGNVLVQGRAHGALSGSLEDLRALIARTQSIVTHSPEGASL